MTEITTDAFHFQAQNQHTVHRIEWHFSAEINGNITCRHEGTIQEVLEKERDFKKLASKNYKKELVIIYRGQAISSHFPCCLIGDERLTIRYITAVNKPKKSVPHRNGPLENLVRFHLFVKCRGTTVRNPELKRAFGELSVYAYKGETVKRALQRDGRLHDIVFKNKCELLQKGTRKTVKFSDLVDDLNDKVFEISASSLPNSPPGSLDDALVMDSQEDQSDSEQDLRHSDPPTAELENENTSKVKDVASE